MTKGLKYTLIALGAGVFLFIVFQGSQIAFADVVSFNEVYPYVKKWSDYYHVPMALIYAIMQQETGGLSLTGHSKEYFRRNQPLMQNAIEVASGGSQGLMQILYSNAQALGYTGTPAGLSDPDTGIEYGTAWLSGIINGSVGGVEVSGHSIDVTDVANIAAQYNDGKDYSKATSSTRNTYVPNVLSFYNYYAIKLSQMGVSSPQAQALPAGASGSVSTRLWDTMTGWL